MFRLRGKSVNISEKDPTYKVKYLGNVLTAFMKGEGCVDRPASVLWNNYLTNPDCVSDMQLMVCVSGLKAATKQNGMTEYRAHRISYCVCHPQYPRLFIWVYRHEAKKMKVELRCHAVLCKNEGVAKAIAVQLHDKLSFALAEFSREKTRRQRARLAMQRANSAPSAFPPCTPSNSVVSSSVPSMRTRFLSVGQNFKPPSDQSTVAPKLGAISEDLEEEPEGGGDAKRTHWNRVTSENGNHPPDDIDEEEEDFENSPVSDDSNEDAANHRCASSGLDADETGGSSQTSSAFKFIAGELTDGDLDLEIGNDILVLKKDVEVQLELAPQRRSLGFDSDSDCSSGGGDLANSD